MLLKDIDTTHGSLDDDDKCCYRCCCCPCCCCGKLLFDTGVDTAVMEEGDAVDIDVGDAGRKRRGVDTVFALPPLTAATHVP